MQADRFRGAAQGAYSFYFFTVALLVLVLLLYLCGHVKTMSQSRELARLQDERQALVQRQHRLRNDITSLKQSSRIREIATQRLGMVFPSEQPRNLYLNPGEGVRTNVEKGDAN